ncbi:MAG TPA: dienelactone hydrolase family protein [Thermoanaerobaculia bacterium]|jgi:carboxymethylenebutenolidase|nr:dienelactone hydrolase family protein [Thermoanaerobaculia bacterium]
MGEHVEFPSNSHSCRGYVAGKGPGVVVIQEWWGLVPHIEDIVDRFAGEGFSAIAPDLFHGATASSPDEAGRMLMELDADRAEKEIAAAGAYLLNRPECTSKKYGVIGFCMGGALAQYTATKESDAAATVSFYGGFKKVASDWKNLSAPILLIYAEKDQGVPAEQGRELAKQLEEMGKDVQLVVYPDVNHAFFNDTGRNYNAAAAADAWKRTIEFFRANVK